MVRPKTTASKRPLTEKQKAGLALGKGRPKGVPNKVTLEAKRLCKSIIDDPRYLKNLKRRMREGTAGQMEVLCWYYACGKPKERVELGADDSLSDLVRKAAGLPPLPREE